MHLGVTSTRLPVSCTYGFGVARRTYDALCWKAQGDSGADADFALQIQVTAMQFNEGLGQRQAETASFVPAVEVAVDLAKPRECFWNVVKRDANSGIDDLEYVTTVHTAPSLQRDLAANWETKVLLRGRSPPANADATTAIVPVAHESNLRAFH